MERLRWRCRITVHQRRAAHNRDHLLGDAVHRSSTKLYYETHRKPWNLKQGERIEVPCGIASFPGENTVPIREWAERSYNVQHWTDMASGGHFAALEEPVQLVDDIRSFFRQLR